MTTLRAYEPFSVGRPTDMDRLFRDMFGGSLRSAPATAGAFAPAIDVEENEDGFTVHMELPGVAPEEVDITLEENVLTVTGERSFYDDKEAEGFRRIERSFGRFHRSIRLPDRVQADGVDASVVNGLLTIHVPKADEAKPRKIEIRS